MPTYEYFCKKCKEAFSLILSLKDHEEKKAQCPKCGGKEIEQQISSFMTKTSRKS
ncbi:MAG: zinc ribbon domain-containing protein [Deltaproteobacteria bacterium]|nr:zinc ribbon domain-containing protein [Deltaproteobacteria bacterium]